MKKQRKTHKAGRADFHYRCDSRVSITRSFISKLVQVIEPVQYRVGLLLCGNQLFNRDMSLEIDRLIEENDRIFAENQKKMILII